jgi:hypothetical protein
MEPSLERQIVEADNLATAVNNFLKAEPEDKMFYLEEMEEALTNYMVYSELEFSNV